MEMVYYDAFYAVDLCLMRNISAAKKFCNCTFINLRIEFFLLLNFFIYSFTPVGYGAIRFFLLVVSYFAFAGKNVKVRFGVCAIEQLGFVR